MCADLLSIAPDYYGERTGLLWALVDSDKSTSKITLCTLLDKKHPGYDTILQDMAAIGHTDAVKFLLDLDLPTSANSSSTSAACPICCPGKKASVPFSQETIDAAFSAACHRRECMTHTPSEKEHSDMIKSLVKAGVSVERFAKAYSEKTIGEDSKVVESLNAFKICDDCIKNALERSVSGKKSATVKHLLSLRPVNVVNEILEKASNSGCEDIQDIKEQLSSYLKSI
jgi:hypothetical protein